MAGWPENFSPCCLSGKGGVPLEAASYHNTLYYHDMGKQIDNVDEKI